MNGWTNPIDPDAPYRRPAPPADAPQEPYQGEAPYPPQAEHEWHETEPAYPARAGHDWAETEAPHPARAEHEWPEAGARYEPRAAAPDAARAGLAAAPAESPFWESTDRPPVGQRRHRAPRRVSRSVTVAGAAAVATLVVAVGAGALLLPADRVAQPSPAAADGTAGGGSGAAGALTGEATSPAPSTSAARGAPPAPPARKPTPSPRRTATKAPAQAGGGASLQSTESGPEQQVIAIVNRERTTNGCGEVQLNDLLATAARLHSQDQAVRNTMSHTGSDGSSPWDRAGRAGYPQAIGENVAAGYRTAAAVMDGWMNSAGHRANILNCQAKAIGVGLATAGNGTVYWTQMFGTQP